MSEKPAPTLFNEIEGRFNGTNSEFSWEGQGWVGTDYDKLWIKSEGTLQDNGTLDASRAAILRTGTASPVSSDSSHWRSWAESTVASAGAVALSEDDEVAADHLGAGDACLGAVADHERAWTSQIAQTFEHPLGAALLYHSN